MTRLRSLVVLIGATLVLLLLYIHSTTPSSQDMTGVDGNLRVVYSSPLPVGASPQSMSVIPRNVSHSAPSIHIRQRQYARRGHVQAICDQNGLGNPPTKSEQIRPDDFSRVFVDEKYKILYCEVPKVACTNWKRIMLILTGHMNTTDPEQLQAYLVHSTYQEKYLRKLDTYKPRQILNRIRHYYKFMFVRHPLERLVSAFRNKFQTSYNSKYPLRYGTKIVRRYRKNPSKHSLQYGDDVRFEEFVRFLLNYNPKYPLDPHWKPYYQICHPCMVQYDFVGKYETLQEDVDFILEELGVKHLLSFPKRPQLTVPRTSAVLNSVFANISSEQLHNLWKFYSVDFSMFEYPYPDFS